MSVTALTRERELVRLATAGSVDDGKSTLIGRLLLDTGSLLSDHLDDVSGDGAEPDLAAITDGLRAEREQGITIDVAYRFFSTETRSFILADTPGHERYTRNMFTGASTADVAVVLIDARSGVVTQTRRHANIAALLGIEHMVVCVNKMDLVGWDQRRFAEIVDQVHDLTRRLDILDLTIVPISALHGDNVAFRSDRAPFHSGPTLLEYLEEIDVQADRDLDRLRLPIQWVGRPPDNDRLYAGRIVAGTLATGDEVRGDAGRNEYDGHQPGHARRRRRGGATDVRDARACRPTRRRPRRHARGAGRAAAGRARDRMHHLLDERGAASPRPALRAQAHHPHGPGDGALDPRPDRPRDARATDRTHRARRSTTSVRSRCVRARRLWPIRMRPTGSPGR